MGNPVSWTQGDGPLVPFVDGFRRELAGVGHPPGVVRLHVALMGQLDGWLSAAGLGAGDLSPGVARRFLAGRRARGLRRVPTLAGLAPLLGYLRGEGVLAPEPPAALTDRDVLLARYRGYLAGDRGLAPTTVERYERFARRFLAGRASRAGGGTGAEGLASSEVNSFLLGAASRLTTVDSLKREAADLQSLLRFLYLAGVVETDLGAAMPPAAGWRGTRLPSALGRAEVEALLGSCDRSTPGGRRDRAIMALLARLGLRCGEVAALQFADIDWRAGEIAVCGKGRRRDRLPLPAEAGEALVAYLASGRPACRCRQVFVTVNAPHRPLLACSVTAVVYRACDRAGLGRAGGHRLRHALATEMLRQGGDLIEIAQVLRHSDLAATAGYAKVDRAALRMVASPWPGAGR
jgi:site-specific recombinase XerD